MEYYMKLVVGALEIFEASRAEIGPSLYHILIRPFLSNTAHAFSCDDYMKIAVIKTIMVSLSHSDSSPYMSPTTPLPSAGALP
jgi:hypothetical protein